MDVWIKKIKKCGIKKKVKLISLIVSFDNYTLSDCHQLINIKSSNFNIYNLTNINIILSDYLSLKNVNLFNIRESAEIGHIISLY